MPPPPFHYIKHGRAFGPVTRSVLLKMVENGILAESDLVRIEGVTSWRPAQQVVESVRGGAIVSVPPPAAPPSQSGAGRNDTVFTHAPPASAAAAARAGRRRLRKCVHCGTRTSRDACFCHKCNGDLTARGCRGCAGVNPAHAKFCGRCGNAL